VTSVTVRLVKKARVRAVSSDKTLGEWMEEAVEERVAREEREKSRQNEKDLG